MNTPKAKAYYIEGIDAYFEDDYKKALSCFDSLVSLDNNNTGALLKRAYTYNKLGKKAEAIEDLKRLVSISHDNQELLGVHYKSLVQLGKWLFEEKRYESAIAMLLNAKRINPGDQDLAHYIEKIRVKLESTQDISLKKLDIDCSYLPQKPRTGEGREISYAFNPLRHDVDPTQSEYRILSTKIEIKLKKQVLGLFWDSIEALKTVIGKDPVSAYPTSNQRSKNWDALSKEIEKQEAANVESEDVHRFFETIYKDADSDARRAMVKSYVESNGTTLSTNWDDVKKRKVEPNPPEGMVSKRYD
ncbi:Suppressor of G2 allele of SKP1-like protein [Zancudomyces culisetae]|uniref:Suppressor of G2 allele of SKP1-like protein n=1 Tax=Zancudomyces culisetae TaxID=1213189 RepID=A0A1R1PQU5_ZANCU|nr:Suppressor of G2 allele of SKP1-like protein [Zancudomyces culisetae]OMH83355.1 Suppressor of G2 allele of SKP1-like protein [Zancudomyces culisetae]|eukprot:OMH78664.1 Suppressor of G2 allele of SKP1-like protein [Zancudomyces culisetae]